jgi:hypoxanthine phosphoribosyltransferase
MNSIGLDSNSPSGEENELQILFRQEEIAQTVVRLAEEIKRDYRGENPLLIGVLKGCFVFMADLTRRLDMPLEIEFVALSSYGRGREKTSGRVKVVRGLTTPVKGRHVLVVEDIVDTGLTLNFFLNYLRRRKPASIKVCSLLDKVEARQVSLELDYRGFVVPDAFIVGYGLDWDEKYRYLPDICSLKPNLSP